MQSYYEDHQKFIKCTGGTEKVTNREEECDVVELVGESEKFNVIVIMLLLKLLSRRFLDC